MVSLAGWKKASLMCTPIGRQLNSVFRPRHSGKYKADFIDRMRLTILYYHFSTGMIFLIFHQPCHGIIQRNEDSYKTIDSNGSDLPVNAGGFRQRTRV